MAGCGGDDENNGADREQVEDAGLCRVQLEGERAFADAVETGGRTLDGFNYRECVGEAPSGDKLAIGVIDSDKRYASLAKNLAGAPGFERVKRLGEEAFAANGFSSEERGGTSGRTVYIDDGDRTVVVALDAEGGEVVALARGVLAGLD